MSNAAIFWVAMVAFWGGALVWMNSDVMIPWWMRNTPPPAPHRETTDQERVL